MLQKFTVGFSFAVAGATVPLDAVLDITDTNGFSLARVQPEPGANVVPSPA